jgi:hypothetical protein
MIPYLAQPLAESLAGVTVERMLLDWPALVQSYALLVGVYGSALALLVLVLGRPRVHRPPWMGDE